MAESKAKQESVSLPSEAIDFVEKLSKLRIFGKNRSEVYRYFIRKGIDEAIRDNLVEKTLRTMKLLNEVRPPDES